MIQCSVVIPTRGRHDLLQNVYRSLTSQQNIDPSDFELIIIADGLDEPGELPFPAHHRIKTHYQTIPHGGPAVARNRGVSLAQGKFVLFIGNDTIADRNLIAEHCSFHADHDAAACLGSIRTPPELLQTNLEQFLQLGSQFHIPTSSGEVDFWHFYTANISVPLAIFHELGGFDESFSAAGWEDIEFGYRLSKKYSIWFNPAALVEHRHPTSLEQFGKRQVMLGCDTHLLLHKHPELDQYFKLKQYPLHSVAKYFLALKPVRKTTLFFYPLFSSLAYFRFVHYYFRILRYQYFFQGYLQKLRENRV